MRPENAKTMMAGPLAAPLAHLELEGLSLGGDAVLGALDLTIHAGETVALVGPSGVGKTTLLRILAGLETGFAGNRNVVDAVALVFQEPTLLLWRRVIDNITLTTGCSQAEAAEHLAEVGLARQSDLFPTQLSLGQQRRLSLARAFAARPKLLLLDEPFVSLDPDLVNEMMTLFDHLREQHKITTVLVTHSEAEAMRLATRIVRLAGRPARVVSDKPI